jgi:hypothetical protein
MSSTLMPAKGRFDASPLLASVASRRTWLHLDQLIFGFRNDSGRANIDLLNTMFAILEKEMK